jgi:hypothetical protein
MVNSISIVTFAFLFLFKLMSLVKNVLSSCNYTYFFDNTQVNFTKAVQKCSKLNATVLVIENACEDKFIKDFYLKNASNGIWLGIYYFIGNKTNVNYYTNKTLTYYNWHRTYTINLKNRCVRYSKSLSAWIDSLCTELKYVVCKVSDKCGSCNCSLPTTSTTTTTTPIIPTTPMISETIITSNSVPNELITCNYTYIFLPEEVNFTEAVEICRNLNSTVLVIENECENKFIKANYLMNATNGIWLGNYDLNGDETNVNYYTNKTVIDFNGSNILSSATGERCVRLTNVGTWADTVCSDSFSIVCKFSDSGSCNCPSDTTTKTALITSTSTPTTPSKTESTSKHLGVWSEWSSWQICILEKKRKLINDSVEIFRSNISCDLICKLFDLNINLIY